MEQGTAPHPPGVESRVASSSAHGPQSKHAQCKPVWDYREVGNSHNMNSSRESGAASGYRPI